MRIWISTAAFLAMSSAAFAAPFDWSGFYIGVNSGFSAGTVDFESAYDEADHSLLGGLFGVEAGYNFVEDNVVWGLEGSIGWDGMHGAALVDEAGLPWGDQFENTDYRWLATITPRIGYLANENTLIFAKGGLSLANYDAYFSDNFTHPTANQTQIGGVFGIGVDFALDENWTIGAEYDASLYGSSPRYNGLSTYMTATATHAVLFRANYHPH